MSETYDTCAKCGHRIVPGWGDTWSHFPTMPMSATELRKLRHIPKVAER